MNALSWTLYLAEVSDSLRGFGGFVTWFAFAIMILCVVATLICAGAASDYSKKRDDKEIEEYESAVTWRNRFFNIAIKTLLPIFLVAFFVSGFIPSRNTLMLIAASQFGEVVLTSENAQKIGGETADLATDSIRLLHQYVQDQLNPPKPEPKSSD